MGLSNERKILIVIPTYNERDNIEKLLGRLLNMIPKFHMLVVDDNSPDGTGRIAAEISKRFDRVHVLHRKQKEGIGPAYVAGFQWGLSNEFDIFIEMDADLSHRPRYLPKMIEQLKDHDLVIGSRWMPGGKISNWSISRVFLSRFANMYASWVLGVPVYDLTGGFNCYTREVLKNIGLDNIHSDGYSFQIEIKYRALQKGFRHIEIPITFTDRKAGASKISKHIVFEATWMVWKLKLFVPKSQSK